MYVNGEGRVAESGENEVTASQCLPIGGGQFDFIVTISGLPIFGAHAYFRCIERI